MINENWTLWSHADTVCGCGALALSQMLEIDLMRSQLQGWHPEAMLRFQYLSSHSSQSLPITPVLQGHCPVLGSQKQGLPRGHRVSWVPRRSQEHSGKYFYFSVCQTIVKYRKEIQGIQYRWSNKEENLCKKIIDDGSIHPSFKTAV